MQSRWAFGICLAASLVHTAVAAADDDDDDSPTFPGLLARYSSAGEVIERTDETIAFDWGANSPDPRLSPAPFLANWSGTLLVRPTTKYQFHAWLHGDVTVLINGVTVLSDERRTPGWVTGPVVPLKSGDAKIEIAYRSRPEKATLKLFWSSETFALEPLPDLAIVHEERRADLDLIARGRREFAGHRCNRCHARVAEPLAPPAASLRFVAGNLEPEAILEKVVQGYAAGGGGRMPRFGFDAKEAESITAFLLSVSEKPKLESLPKLKPDDPAAQARLGSTLFRSVGCVACHDVPRSGEEASKAPAVRIRPDGTDADRFVRQPFSGGDLTRIGKRRAVEWIYTWLAAPETLNADHQMPVFRLTSAERAQLALFLAGESNVPQPSPANAEEHPQLSKEMLQDAERIAAGKRLVQESRCASCHEIPTLPEVRPSQSALFDVDPEWKNACVQNGADRSRNRPVFLDRIQTPVRVFLTRAMGDLAEVSSDIRGLDLLERNNCLGCHDRGPRKGISGIAAEMTRDDESLRGQSVALIPPSLTAVGDRLEDAALAEAVTGELKNPRLPWLRVRMPKFKHTDAEKAALVDYFRLSDRIPDPPSQSTIGEAAPTTPPGEPISAERLLLGRQLLGPTGFSCIACHEVGAYKPKNVAIGTRGSDLMKMAGRMRKPYFPRWTRSPARIVPGMEMPTYQRPVPNILGESIDAQLMAIWDAINDPRFTPPTNPTAVEQYLIVGANERPQIVRDVFTNPENFGPSFVSRAVAIGFPNGHSLLFDFDTFTLRQWTFGDFARQRTEGKSWYWDMAGLAIVGGADPRSDFVLRKRGGGDEKAPLPIGPHSADSHIVEYRNDGDAIILSYILAFPGIEDGKPRLVRIDERLTASESADSTPPNTAIVRTLSADSLPEGHELLLATHQSSAALGSGRIERIDAAEVKWIDSTSDGQALPRGVQRRLTAFLSNDGDATVTLRYEAELVPRRLAIPAKPVSMASNDVIATTPGYEGRRLPIEGSIMPTGLAFSKKGTIALTSLKGHLQLVHDKDSDGLPETLSRFEEGLAAPYGLIADGEDWIVAHKPEVLRLTDVDGDGRADRRAVVATGWGYSDNYHDWTCGFARDADQNLFVGLGSDYSQPNRSKSTSRWRGKVLRISPAGKITPVAHGFRYPTGLALDEDGRLYVTDNQGVQNTFNELNHIQEGRSYGVPSRHEEDPNAKGTPPAIQIPHPWTRSVNGIAFFPRLVPGRDRPLFPADHPAAAYAGHAIGCEYDSRFLVRFTVQAVGDVMQGAVYPFSLPDQGAGGKNFTGPLSIAIGAEGEMAIGSIHDSGWLGGLNTGDITLLRPKGQLPNGIREMRAVPRGFEVEFLRPIPAAKGQDVSTYSLMSYTRKWKGAYATPDSGRYTVQIEKASLSDDGKTVTLVIDELDEEYVFELNVGGTIAGAGETLFPATASYTLHRRPVQKK